MIAAISPPPPPATLPRIVRGPRKSAVLHASPFSDHPDVLSLNLARGCGQQCVFCSVRGHAGQSPNNDLYLYDDTVARLRTELALRHERPRAVFISPSTEPFPPLAEVQVETVGVVETLAKHGIESWLMTRGFIRPTALRSLIDHREHIKVTVALTTLDRGLQRLLEPLAAPPRLRLRQIQQLRERGVPVTVALDPLVPGLTDTRENLLEVLGALARVGVKQVTASYLFLRDGIRDNLVKALAPSGWDEIVLEAFQGGPLLTSGLIAAARYLPKARRQRGYATLMALAAPLGISVSVSSTTNPDFTAPRSTETRQRSLLPLFG